MKISNYALITALCAVIIGCASNSNNTNIIEQPPQKLNSSAPLLLPQIGKTGNQSISESAAALANESQPTKFKVISEQRGPGGAVNRVNVDNPDGGMPDYYLTPQSNIPTSTNNNPDKLSTPNWQLSW